MSINAYKTNINTNIIINNINNNINNNNIINLNDKFQTLQVRQKTLQIQKLLLEQVLKSLIEEKATAAVMQASRSFLKPYTTTIQQIKKQINEIIEELEDIDLLLKNKYKNISSSLKTDNCTNFNYVQPPLNISLMDSIIKWYSKIYNALQSFNNLNLNSWYQGINSIRKCLNSIANMEAEIIHYNNKVTLKQNRTNTPQNAKSIENNNNNNNNNSNSNNNSISSISDNNNNNNNSINNSKSKNNNSNNKNNSDQGENNLNKNFNSLTLSNDKTEEENVKESYNELNYYKDNNTNMYYSVNSPNDIKINSLTLSNNKTEEENVKKSYNELNYYKDNNTNTYYSVNSSNDIKINNNFSTSTDGIQPYHLIFLDIYTDQILKSLYFIIKTLFFQLTKKQNQHSSLELNNLSIVYISALDTIQGLFLLNPKSKTPLYNIEIINILLNSLDIVGNNSLKIMVIETLQVIIIKCTTSIHIIEQQQGIHKIVRLLKRRDTDEYIQLKLIELLYIYLSNESTKNPNELNNRKESLAKYVGINFVNKLSNETDLKKIFGKKAQEITSTLIEQDHPTS